MKKLAYHALINTFKTLTYKSKKLIIVLAEDKLYPLLLENLNETHSKLHTKHFHDIKDINSFSNMLLMEELFSSEKIIILNGLNESRPQKQQISLLEKSLSALPKHLSHHGFIFLNPSFKKIFDHLTLKTQCEIYLSYKPQNQEIFQVIKSLHDIFDFREAQNSHEKEINLAYQTYLDNFSEIFTHFKRMSVSGLPFYDVIDEFQNLDHPYKVIEALSKNNKKLVIKILSRLEQVDFPIMRVLSSLLYFLKSVIKIKSDLNTSKLPLKDILRKNGIPYPAQENIMNAVKNLNSQKLANFIFAYPEIEKKCRQAKGNSYHIVFTDLLSILMPS